MVFDLEGNWRSGKAYDLHTVASTYLGVDQFGHDRFENTRSEMGELVYALKYNADLSAVPKIMQLLDKISGIEKFDYIIPIPATNKNRPFQPVEAIADALGKRRKVTVLKECLLNSGTEELKSVSDPVARIELLKKALSLSGSDKTNGKSVLLLDDLYRSGATLKLATDLLCTEGKAAYVCVLTMTKTRSNR